LNKLIKITVALRLQVPFLQNKAERQPVAAPEATSLNRCHHTTSVSGTRLAEIPRIDGIVTSTGV